MPPLPPFKTIPVKQVAGRGGLVILLYGSPGIGKTTASGNATFSKYASPGVIFDCEAGVKSVTHLENLSIAEPSPKKWADIRNYTRYYRDTPKDHITEKLVIWDNGSEIAKMALDFVVTDSTQGGGPRTSPEIQHWGRCKVEVETWIRTLRDISEEKGIIFIIPFWERYRGGPEDDTQGAPKTEKAMLSLSLRMAEELPGLVDIIGYITITNTGAREITFAASQRHSAKFRRNRHEHSREVPDKIQFGEDQYVMADIINTLIGGQKFPKEKYARNSPTNQSSPNKQEN